MAFPFVATLLGTNLLVIFMIINVINNDELISQKLLFPQVLMPLMVPLSRALNCLKSKENYKRGNKLDEKGQCWIMLGKKLCDVTFILG